MLNDNLNENPQVPEPRPDGKTQVVASQDNRAKKKKRIYTGFGGFLLFMLAVAVFFFYNFKTVEVNGESMEPTLRDGNRLLISSAYWLVGPVVTEDIVVIKNGQDNDLIIKRVYKTGGQEVDPKNTPSSYRLTDGPYIVPTGTIYVIGDNYEFSQDSRDYGPFSLEDVVGKVVVVQPAIGSLAKAESE